LPKVIKEAFLRTTMSDSNHSIKLHCIYPNYAIVFIARTFIVYFHHFQSL